MEDALNASDNYSHLRFRRDSAPTDRPPPPALSFVVGPLFFRSWVSRYFGFRV
jgi:hypothetical protein